MRTEQFHDEDIGHLLREAAETFRPSVETKEAMRQQLMKQLDQHMETPVVKTGEKLGARRSFRRRLRALASLAGAVVVAVGLGLLVLSFQRPSAAKALEDVARGSDKHEGWVTVTVTEQSGETSTSYRNEAKKIRAMVWRQGNQFRAEFASRASGKRFMYDSQLQELHVSRVGADDFSSGMKGLEIYTVNGFIERMRFDAAGVKLRITKILDGDSLRFDLSVPPGKVSERAVRQLTIWADPRTKLVHRLRMKKGTEVADGTVSYADPGIQSIYDLGAPRDARIAEVRREENIEALLDELDNREAKRFGDAVVLVTETTHFPGGRKALGGVVWVMLTQGKAFYFARYEVGGASHYSLPDGRKGIKPEYMSVPVLDGWPRPSWRVVREALQVAAPNWYFVSDVNEMTQGRFDIEGVHTDDGQVSKKTLDYNRTHAFLAEDLWPCRQNMWLTEDYAASTRVELLEHPHRQIVGVRVRLSVVGHGLKDHVWWFDREHSYVPVERTSEIDQVFPDGSRKTQMHEVRFVDFARLPNDIWFVTRWERPKRDLDGRLLSTIVYEMQVFPEIDLDTDWFSPPKERLNSLLEVNQRR